MVAKRVKDPVSNLIIPGLIEEFEEVDRPASARQKYQTDSHIKALVEGAEKGRAYLISSA